MTDSYKIKNSVLEWLNIIEMKKFVDDVMFLRMKMTLTIWQHNNTIEKRFWFQEALSTLERLHQEDEGEQFAPTPYWKNKQWKSASSSSSTWWEWQDSWWSS